MRAMSPTQVDRAEFSMVRLGYNSEMFNRGIASSTPGKAPGSGTWTGPEEASSSKDEVPTYQGREFEIHARQSAQYRNAFQQELTSTDATQAILIPTNRSYDGIAIHHLFSA